MELTEVRLEMQGLVEGLPFVPQGLGGVCWPPLVPCPLPNLKAHTFIQFTFQFS